MQEVNSRESREDRRSNLRIATVIILALVIALIHDGWLIYDPIDRAHIPGLMTLGVVAIMFVAYKIHKIDAARNKSESEE